MRQVLQNLRSGETKAESVPRPAAKPKHVTVTTKVSLVSAGTERMLVDFGRAGFIEKARQQPDKVREVLNKAKTDGIGTTLNAVFNKLGQPLPLGYCNVGTVVEVGRGTLGFRIGDRVVSNGPHAEMATVPQNLCARIPDGVSEDQAAFTVIGAIGLQGIRLAEPTLGETVVVTGLGLIGLLTVQLLRANGCKVIGIDFDESRLNLAERFGARTIDPAKGLDPVGTVMSLTQGRGADAVIITASTKSNEPVSQAAQMSRQRGRIVLVGVSGLDLSRADFYRKELSFQVSCSYGPGRYDSSYEEGGNDYPLGLVRWTEQRNFEAILEMMESGRLDVVPLVTHRFQIQDAQSAYKVVGGSEPSLAILFDYSDSRDIVSETTTSLPASTPSKTQSGRVSFIGAGNYVSSVLAPAFVKAGASLGLVSATSGVGATHVARKHGFLGATTDVPSVFESDSAAVVIGTRHDSHASLAASALRAGKSVFVEKPLALTLSDLSGLEEIVRAGSPLLTVGFNRRFSKHAIKIKELLPEANDAAFVMTVNAGAIPADHWTQDLDLGGGRIIGEACHFLDLLRFLAGASILEHSAKRTLSPNGDTATVTLVFVNGAIGTIHYFANGSKQFPKERLEVFSAGRILQLDNFRKLKGYGWRGFSKMNLRTQDKGQVDCARAFLNSLRSGHPSIPYDELFEVSRVTLEAAEELRR